MSKPVWEKTNKRTEACWYWLGGVKEKPCDFPELKYCSNTCELPWEFWQAKAEPPDLPDLPEMPRPDLKIDDPVLVWSNQNNGWMRRYFAGWDGNRLIAWRNGCTSWTAENVNDTAEWDRWKLPGEGDCE